MTTKHSITPSQELYGKWYDESPDDDELGLVEYVATQAARWGSDRELEACCEYIRRWFADPQYRIAELRTARRPKPPSLREQALIELGDVYNRNKIDDVTYDTIRLALEQLDD